MSLLNQSIIKRTRGSDVFEEPQHRVGKFRASEVVSRLVTNNLDEAVNMITGQAVADGHAWSPAQAGAGTVHGLDEGRQRRFQ